MINLEDFETCYEYVMVSTFKIDDSTHQKFKDYLNENTNPFKDQTGIIAFKITNSGLHIHAVGSFKSNESFECQLV